MTEDRKHLVKLLDSLTREILWVREQGRCYVCEKEAHEPVHLVTRDANAVRWDTHAEGNVHLGCRTCHDSDHTLGTKLFIDKFIKNRGEEAWKEIRQRSHVHGSFNEDALRMIAQQMVDTMHAVKLNNRALV